MSRRNIFEILNEKESISCQINKIEMLLSDAYVGSESPEDIVDMECMREWKARGRYTSCEEIRKRLQITYEQLNRDLSEEKILFYLEYVSNIIWLCNEKYLEGSEDYNDEYQYLQENVISILDDLGYETRVFEDKEKVILVEKNAAMTAVAEVVDSNTAYAVIEYNHHLLKGDIAEKQRILKLLADKFEPMRGELKKVNKELESNTGYLLNKMNIRHNNMEGKNAIEYVKNLTNEELEEWYDETYQMLLLCFLEYENIERNRKISEIKKAIEK